MYVDDRKEMSCAYENGKVFMANNISTLLLSLTNKYYNNKETVDIAIACLFACKQLITSEESVGIMSQHGAMELPLSIYTCYFTHQRLHDGNSNNNDTAESGSDGIVTIPLLRAVTGIIQLTFNVSSEFCVIFYL